MAFTAQHGTYNVEASFNDWFRSEITANLPPWIDGPYFSASGVNFNFPDKSLTFPCFTVSHLSTIPQALSPKVGVGGSALDLKVLMMDISCWASRTTTAGGINAAARRDVMQLRDMAVNLLMSGRNNIPILDYYVGGLTAVTQLGILRLKGIEDQLPPLDTDPNIRRKRMIVTLGYQELWT